MNEGKGSALKAMVSFFTVIRMPVEQKDLDAMEKRFWLIPMIGQLVGLVAFGVCAIASYCGFRIEVQALFALATAFLFSKFIHLDGLIDFGDGMICSSADREKHIRALKDTLVGAGGVGTGIIVVMIAAVLYMQQGADLSAHLPEHTAVGMAAFICEVLAKNAQVTAAAVGKPGNGMAQRQVSQTGPGAAVKSSLVSLVLISAAVMAAAYATGLAYNTAGILWYVTPVAALFASVLAGALVARTANRAFGFVNGDILGASNEISRLFVLVTIAVVLNFGGSLRWMF